MTLELTRWGTRAMTIAIAAALAPVITVGSSGTSAADEPPTPQQRNAEVVRNAFALGVGHDAHTFYSILAEDVQWTVARADAPRTYTSRSQFLQEGAGPIQSRLTGPIQANVRQLIAENDVVVAIWDGAATARDGRPYFNSYAWVLTMRDERVVRATAFLDLVVLNELLERVEPA
ncbi:nuclear transport factor 2 family protein [Mycolicibacterium baixiangningiae]|uniref:nuclear transport factor 2 family protein n=1 Tax=Mycolicibacterium baixiangningiae TaxID=2761578 RepID=UPI001E5EC0F2|nr:nuclear transport factor 2 family protein [Mycolicibacterium baixiangningiae]